MLDANDLAKKIVKGIKKNKQELNTPFNMFLGAILFYLIPNISDKIILKMFKK